MKFLYLIIFLFSFSNFSCSAQEAQPILKILNINSISQLVKVQINNKGKPDSLYYYIGLEQKINSEWTEILIDMSENVPDKAAIVRKLAPGAMANKAYPVRHIPEIYRNREDSFRLKITYSTSISGLGNVAYSDAFRLNR